MARKGLSKSKIISGLQCPKRLYLEVYQPDVADGSESVAAFATGHELGDLARTLYPQGVLVGHNDDLAAAIEGTQRHLSSKKSPTIFEGTFSHQGVLVRTDILSKGPGGLCVTEVKASTSVKDYHLLDCAIQAWVIQRAGHKIERIQLAHVNRDFVYPGGGQYQGILSYVDLTEDAFAHESQVTEWVQNLKGVLAGGVPDIEVGDRCHQPFPCPFQAHCQPPQPDYPVTALPGKGKIIQELLAEGIEDIRDIPEGRLTRADHERVRRVTVAGTEELQAGADEILAELPFPRYYLDFETIGMVVPRWEGTRPYQALPFQWSCHIEHENGEIDHVEFLDTSGEPPMRRLAEEFIKTLNESGPIFTYTNFENGVISGLARMYHDLAPELERILDRLFDLHPLVRKHYYHPDMLGSWSIKAVLPAIAPDLSYQELNGVQDGIAAGMAYLEALDPQTEKARREELIRSMLDYCKLDTLAMVRVAHKLMGKASSKPE